jgi:hypothetical protein
MESRDEFADAVRARLSGYGLPHADRAPVEVGDLTPPWVRAEVAKAQAFIDREWAAHLHETTHVRLHDWRLAPDLILYSSLGDVQLVHVECRYCRIDAYTRSLRGWCELQPPTCGCGCDTTTE